MLNIKDIKCEKNTCPVKKTAEIVGQKWTTLIIRDLLSEPKGFAEIQRLLKGISPKVLTDRLRFLESKKIISRKVFPTNPPTTEYKLTTLGKKLENVIVSMAEFGEII